MASPLRKRFPRELKNNLGKYLGIFLLMSVTIALTSGFLLAAHSIGVIIDDMPEKYSIEDARFTTAFEATDEQLNAAADAARDAGAGSADIFRNWSFDADFNHAQGDDGRDRTLRVYQHRTQVDLAAYAEGRVPEAADEVAIDRVFATNNGITVGEEVELFGPVSYTHLSPRTPRTTSHMRTVWRWLPPLRDRRWWRPPGCRTSCRETDHQAAL